MAHKQSTSDEVPFCLDLLEPNWLQAQAMVSLMGSICVYAVQFPVPSLILFLVITIALLIVGSSQPQNVERSPEHFYCHFTNNIGVYTVTTFTVVFVIAAVILIFCFKYFLLEHFDGLIVYNALSN
ncbi:hypothetical protein F5876DRAFT_70864 [Lentinula aff. lateritia]|uniref:Uncharacterized protein n=1 Tax=Lentinula aff. lateritia TaxID=2804960 RepID=A0ACC1TI15_9AGAR|nr:hypothetical protein F5876DRAFT_70864 [Lentinula aff. lateritia]